MTRNTVNGNFWTGYEVAEKIHEEPALVDSKFIHRESNERINDT